MLPEKKREVIGFLMAMPLSGVRKRELLLGWARTVGVRLQARDFQQVEESGVG